MEAFSNDYKMKGEQLVAVDMVLRNKDKFYGQWVLLHVPYRSLEDLVVPGVAEKVPKKDRQFATALKLCDDLAKVPQELLRFWRQPSKVRAEMRQEARTQDYIEDTVTYIAAQTKLVDMYLAGCLQLRPSEVDNASTQLQQQEAAAHTTDLAGRKEADLDFNSEQRNFEMEINKRVDIALDANGKTSKRGSSRWTRQEEADAARELASKSKPVVCLGPPGTGKTTVVKRCCDRAVRLGGKVLLALPTAQLASRMRARFQDDNNVDVDTCHAAFKLEQDEAESLPLMTMYDLVVIDELSLLDAPQFERMLRLWRAADKVPALVFLGDRYQLPGVGDTRPWESSAWKKQVLKFVKLYHPWRCQDKDFNKVLKLLRTSKPSKRQVTMLCRGHKAWRGEEPTVEDMKRLLKNEKTKETTIVTCTRRAAAKVNDLMVQAHFGKKKPLTMIPGDLETEPANYDQRGKLKTSGLVASQVPIYKGMKLYLTKNVRKEDDYVNGMQVTVENYYEHENCLRVMTKTGKRLMITPWTDVQHGKVTYFPVRLGYASTIHKVQGDEFKHITIWLDVPGMAAAGYTALSRVCRKCDYLLGGWMTPEHFVPATHK